MKTLVYWLSCALLMTTVVSGCSDNGDGEMKNISDDTTLPAPAGGDLTAVSDPGDGPRIVGSFLVHVDMTNPESPIFTVEDRLSAPHSAAGDLVPQAAGSVLSDLSFHGPGSWNGSTHVLTATVRITASGALKYFDEPWMEVLTITPDDEGIVFQQIHAGSGGVGSKYYYADLEDGENGTSAKQDIAIYDPGDVSFNFSVDVLAETYATAQSFIFGDADDDYYNEEYSSASDDFTGADCDDTNPSIYPGTGGCECWTGCDSGCGPGYDCCEETCTGNCSVDCTDTACECYLYPDTGDNLTADCQEGTTCSVISDGGRDMTLGDCDQDTTCNLSCVDSHNCKIADCENGSTCSADCTNSSDCRISNCETGSTCSIDCEGSKNCWISQCDGASTCTLNCSNGDDDCQIGECTGGSDCTLSCDTLDKCTIDPCEDGSTCDIACYHTDECALKCTSGSTCSFLCDPTINGKCTFECKDGMELLDCGSDLYMCGPSATVACP